MRFKDCKLFFLLLFQTYKDIVSMTTHGQLSTFAVKNVPTLELEPDVRVINSLYRRPIKQGKFPLLQAVKGDSDILKKKPSFRYYYDEFYDSYSYEDSDSDYDSPEKQKPIKKKGKNKFEKIEEIKEKIYEKFLDKYLHLKTKKAPKPPDWALEMYARPAPYIELPPWHKIL